MENDETTPDAITDPKDDPLPDQLEPPSDREVPADPPAGSPDEPAVTDADIEAQQAYKSDPRSAIYRRSTELHAAEQQASDQLFVEPAARRADPTDTPDSERQPTLASDGKKVRIVVYGQEREVPEAEVIEAGRRYLQKDAAADHKMTEVGQRAARLQQEEQRLLHVADNLRKGLDENGQPIVAQPPATGAASRTNSREKLENAVKAIYSGDTEEATAALASVVDAISAGTGTPNQASPEVVKSIEDRVLANIEARRRSEEEQNVATTVEQDRQAANRVFLQEYAAIGNDPDLMAMAQGMSGRLAQESEWADRTLVDKAREIGRRVTAKVKISPAGELEARRSAKRDLGSPPAGGRVPTPPEGPKVPTNRQYIDQLRKNAALPPAR